VDLAALVSESVVEDAALTGARERARELGLPVTGAETGALLSVLATLVNARTAVETGTGAGISALWILRGMRTDGVLTSIDADGDHQRLARETLVHGDITTSRARLITGDALEVLPRLTDGGYDLVHLDAQPATYPEQLDQARRLLRPGGVVVLSGVLRGGHGARDKDALGSRAVLDLTAGWDADGTARRALFPLDDGVLVLATPIR
jgi:predicted O-methyltransferase YrrM